MHNWIDSSQIHSSNIWVSRSLHGGYIQFLYVNNFMWMSATLLWVKISHRKKQMEHLFILIYISTGQSTIKPLFSSLLFVNQMSYVEICRKATLVLYKPLIEIMMVYYTWWIDIFWFTHTTVIHVLVMNSRAYSITSADTLDGICKIRWYRAIRKTQRA